MANAPLTVISLTRVELINLALAVSAAAAEAYSDDRFVTASTNHALAARLWAHAGYNAKAATHSGLAAAIDLEAVEAVVQAAQDDEEDY